MTRAAFAAWAAILGSSLWTACAHHPPRVSSVQVIGERSGATAMPPTQPVVIQALATRAPTIQRTIQRLPEHLASVVGRHQAVPSADNLIISPTGMTELVGMLLTCSRGETARQLSAVLGMGKAGSSDPSAFDALRTAIAGNNAVQSQNSIWVLATHPSCAPELSQRFQTRIAPPEIAAVSKQVRGVTRGQIGNVALPPATSFIALNATHFRGRWIHAFDIAATTIQPFHGASRTSLVPLMRGKQRVKYAHEDGWQFVELAMADDTAIDFGLPDRSGPVRLSANLELLRQRMEDAPLSFINHVYLPRFSVQQTVDLTQALKNAGARRAFSDTADFGPLLGSSHIGFDAVYAQSAFKIDEQGVEASSVSIAVTLRYSGPPPKEFRVDRPFVFVIVSGPDRLPIFEGAINNI